MRRVLLLLLLCGPLLGLAAEPEVKVRTQLLPSDAVFVNGTLTLQVDLLVSTWFSRPPQLPPLNVAGALVSGPAGEAMHLTEKIDGKAFFGLRFHYQITPQSARGFDIPSLDIHVLPGQGSVPLHVHSQTLHFTARQLADSDSGLRQQLVANRVTVRQELMVPHEPLRVGDSVTRRVLVRAEGAPAMMIPELVFVDVDGLRRYPQAPTVRPLSPERGGVWGGERTDAVTYVVSRPGDFELPTLLLHWWEAGSGKQQSVSLEALTLSATSTAAYQAPFLISDDLRELRRWAWISIVCHWLGVTAALVPMVALAWVLYVRRGRLRITTLDVIERRRQAWRNSPAYAWRQVRRELKSRPPQVGALYLWLYRLTGLREIRKALPDTPCLAHMELLDFLRSCYGAAGLQASSEPDQLLTALPEIYRELRSRRNKVSPSHSLKPMSPCHEGDIDRKDLV